jgi:hypothetical protein
VGAATMFAFVRTEDGCPARSRTSFNQQPAAFA